MSDDLTEFQIQLEADEILRLIVSAGSERTLRVWKTMVSRNKIIEDDWIRWEGGSQPVPDGTPLFLRMQNARRQEDIFTFDAAAWIWEHNGSMAWIRAYRHPTRVELALKRKERADVTL